MKKLDSQQQNVLIALRGLSMMCFLRLNNDVGVSFINTAWEEF